MTEKRCDDKQGFYQNLVPFTEFSHVADLAHYSPLPDDWAIIIADIRGSTKAIEEGRYKDVNMMGAGCITAILNVTRDHEIPYVFGGDGATLAIPNAAVARVRKALLGAQTIARAQFGLDLRIGAVPIEDIRQIGANVLVAKYQLSPGNYLAMFSGGGVEQVDQMIKNSTADKNYHFTSDEAASEIADMDGLSCRWQPLKSRRGTILSLLVQAQGKQGSGLQRIYREVIQGITDILGYDPTDASPVHEENMEFKWPPAGLKAEIKATSASKNKFIHACKLYVESLIQWGLEKTNQSAGGYNAPIYKSELQTNSDFRRFDDMLRLVLDCTTQQADEIDAFLKRLNGEKRLAYGIHLADHALMTCLVFNLTQSEHIHFIDGADGGFSLAARQLKSQLKNL